MALTSSSIHIIATPNIIILYFKYLQTNTRNSVVTGSIDTTRAITIMHQLGYVTLLGSTLTEVNKRLLTLIEHLFNSTIYYTYITFTFRVPTFSTTFHFSINENSRFMKTERRPARCLHFLNVIYSSLVLFFKNELGNIHSSLLRIELSDFTRAGS